MAHLFLLISWLPVGLRSRYVIPHDTTLYNSTFHSTVLYFITPFHRTILHYSISHNTHGTTSHHTTHMASHHITSHHTSHQTILRGITPPHHTMHQTPVAESMNWVPEKDITHARVLATCSYRKYQLGCSKCRQVVVSLILGSGGSDLTTRTGSQRPKTHFWYFVYFSKKPWKT